MSYCRNCGKEIDSNEELCETCRNRALILDEGISSVDTTKKQNGGHMDGFVFALWSCILGTLSVFFSYFIILFPLISIIMIAQIVISIVFGVRSINQFVENKRLGKTKPIATLVCGIVGCVSSGIAIFISFIMIFTLLSLV